MANHEQRCVVTFLCLQGRRSKTIQEELNGVLGEAAVSLVTIRRWCGRLKGGNFSPNDEFTSGRPRNDIGEARFQFRSKEPFLSARVLAKRLATGSHTIKEILIPDLEMRKFTRI
jgi:transposase